MARNKIGQHLVSEYEMGLITRIFRDQTDTQQFIKFLGEVQKMYAKQQQQATEAYLMNDEPVSRGVALQFKGKVNCITDLVQLLQSVNK